MKVALLLLLTVTVMRVNAEDQNEIENLDVNKSLGIITRVDFSKVCTNTSNNYNNGSALPWNSNGTTVLKVTQLRLGIRVLSVRSSIVTCYAFC